MTSSKVSVGNTEIVSFLDTSFEVDWKVVFPNIDLENFQPYRDLYPGSYGEGKFRTYAHAYAIRSQGRTVLCDTGLGPGGGGRLLDDMRAKGVLPEEVDIVVFTHLHGDHIGWNLTSDKVPTFPKARYLVPQADWDFFVEQQAQGAPLQQVLPLKDLGVLELFSGERTLTPEITTYPTPGHTPGHTSLMISSAGERAILTGDLAHHPAQVDHSEWRFGFDSDPEQGVETRCKVFDQLERDGLVVAICHFPDPGFGRLVRLQGRRIFQVL